jgi:hypothetical protein
MPDGKGREKTKGRSLVVLSTMRRNIVFEKAVFLFFAQALIIAMAKVNETISTNHIGMVEGLNNLFKYSYALTH